MIKLKHWLYIGTLIRAEQGAVECNQDHALHEMHAGKQRQCQFKNQEPEHPGENLDVSSADYHTWMDSPNLM